MRNLKVTGTGAGYTLISNVFIDKYMITSGSSHLKTYLLLLRLMSDPQKEISISGMADILDCSESDVLRSLRHWEKRGLMELQYDRGENVLSGILLLEPREEEHPDDGYDGYGKSAESRSSTAKSVGNQAVTGHTMNVAQEEALPPRPTDLSSVSGDENFSRLLFIAEQYIGTPLSRLDCESFAWLYDGLKLEVSLLEYLVEYCVSNGHRSVRYMEAVATDWHRKKIQTVEQARIYTPLHNKNLYAVMKALGLNDRQPTPQERKIIDNWFQEYGFSLDMVVEACNRTMISIHKPSLNYVESILSRWKKAGISNLEQVQKLDEQFQKQKEDEKNSSGRISGNGTAGAAKHSAGNSSKGGGSNYRISGSKPGARFHDFDQRNYDYDELLKQINS